MTKLFPGLRLIALNNVYGDSNNFWLYVNATDPDDTLQWLSDQLLDAEKAGDKVQIIAHINGGDGESLEGWDENYYKIVNRFANTISGQFYGHTHYEMFYMTYSDMNDYTSTPTSVVFSAPSLTPYDRYFPAYRIYTIDGNYPGSSFSVIDWEEWFFNLTLNNALPPSQAKWEQLYPSMLKEYGMDSAIPSEFHKLIERMKTDDDLYTKFYTNMNRRNQYDGYTPWPCDTDCKNFWLCTCRQFHHSKGKLCSDLPVHNAPVKKSRKYQAKWNDLQRRYNAYKQKRRDSDTCPI
ncbi:hypothetical protein WR25_16225 [Diploscapter pachys]|uniref:Uncharacterized protein n=1 Tax=Diploscapter pachys TaxID=2018661 RepID=A0A2A2KS83_9BILA|nr:hypothetical protein WR25_16225 [Diploscapter pachys]